MPPSEHRRVPRLMIRDDEDWRSIVTHMVASAALVVVDAVQLSPGLWDELEAIARDVAALRTVVVLHDSESEDVQRLAEEQQWVKFSGGAVAAYKRLSQDDLVLGPFSRVISIDEFAATPLDQAAQFADLVLEARYLRGLEPSARRRRYEGLSAADRAGELAEAGQLGEAAIEGVSALGVLVDLGDVSSVIGVSADLAFVTAALGDKAKARDSVEWLLGYTGRLSRAERVGLLHRFRGILELPVLLESLDEPELRDELRASFLPLAE